MKTIFKFEFLYNYKRPFSYVLIALMIIQGIWYSFEGTDYYGNANTLLNSASTFYQNLSIMGMIGIIIIVVISVNSLARDIESATAEGLFSKVSGDKRYFAGKYLCSLFIGSILTMGYPLGMLMVPHLGFGTPEQYGPVPWGQIGHALLIFTIPNLVFMVSLAFFLISFTRRSGSAYVGALFIMFLVMVGDFVRGETHYDSIVHLLDPFSWAGVMDTVDSLGIAERNTAYLPLIPSVIVNRIMWLAVSIVLFLSALWRFDFKYFIAGKSKKKASQTEELDAETGRTNEIPAATMAYNSFSMFSRAFRFAWVDYRSLSRSAFFRFVMAIFFLSFLLTHLVWTSQYYITTSHLPLTHTITYARIPMIVMIGIVMIILAVEHLFRERTSGVWQITDAMPVPNWLFMASKFITQALIAFTLIAMALVTGLVVQLISGFTDINGFLYVEDLFGTRLGWITLLEIIALAFFSGSVFANRFKGHIITVTFFLSTLIALDLDLIEQIRFAYPMVPGTLDYSEMIGYGIFETAMPWYSFAWGSLALILLILATLFWNRGADRTFLERIRAAGKKFTPAVWGAMGLLAVFFVTCEWVIHDNVMVKAQYQTQDEKNAEDAYYERTYAAISETAQPKITDISLNLEIYPEIRTAAYEAGLVLENRSDLPIELLHVEHRDFLTIEKMEASRDLIKTDENEVLRHTVFRLSPPLLPGETMDLSVAARLKYEGFHQNDPQADLTKKTAFLGTDILPYFGYDEDRRLTNNKDRIEQGLSTIEFRTAPQDNTFALKKSLFSDQVDTVAWDLTIGAPENWQIIAPGRHTGSWQKNGRRYTRYISEKLGHLDFRVIGSAYDARDFEVNDTPVSILFYSPHTYNIECMESAITKAFSWLSDTLGHYPYSKLSVVEKTFFDDDFVTFSNVIAISEKHGWTADIEATEDREYIYYTMARELARQWTTARISPADVQGAEVFAESIPEYLALSFMESAFGPERAAVWLEEDFKDYQEGKGEEEIMEKPLLEADKAIYVSRNKGGLVLRALSHRWNKDDFDTWLKNWLESAGVRFGTEFVVSGDFYNDLLSVLPKNLHSFAEECFTKRMQYSMILDSAEYRDGKVSIEVTATRGIMDGIGNLTEETGSFPVDAALIDKTGARISTEEIVLEPGKDLYRIKVSSRPAKVVLDPDYLYLAAERDKATREVN